MFGTSCDSLEPLDRDLPNDPRSQQFVPAAPVAISMDLSGTEPVVRWEPGSPYADGVRVERSLDGGSTYETLAELPANAIMYRDTSGVLSLNTFYRVTSFKETPQGTNAVMTASVKVEFARIQEFRREDAGNGLVRTTWKRSEGLATHAAIRRTGETEWLARTSLGWNEHMAVFDPEIYAFREADFEIVTLWESAAMTLELNTLPFSIDGRALYAPRDLEIELLDELTTRLEWSRGAAFPHQQLVQRRQGGNDWNAVAWLSGNDSVFVDANLHLEYCCQVSYRISGAAEARSSRWSEKTILLDLAQPRLDLDESASEALPTFRISSVDPRARGLVVQRSDVSLHDFKTVAELDASIRSWTDASATTNTRGYTYRISTLNSVETSTAVSYRLLMDEVSQIQLPSGSVYRMAFTPSGRTLIVAGHNAIDLVDMESRSYLRRLTTVEAMTISLSVHPAGRMLAVAFRPQSPPSAGVVLDLVTGATVRTIGVTSLNDVAFSPDGSMLAAMHGLGSYTVWNTDGWGIIHAATGSEYIHWLQGIAFDPGSQHFAVSRMRSVDLMRTSDGRLASSLRLPGSAQLPHRIRFSPDGSRVAFSASGTGFFARVGDAPLNIGPLNPEEFHPERLEVLGLIGSWVPFPGTAAVVDFSSRRIVSQIATGVSAALYIPGTDGIVTGHEDGLVKFWNPRGWSWTEIP